MCGRFALVIPTEKTAKYIFGLSGSSDIKSSYNIAPTQTIAAILNDNPTEVSFVRWGLVPFWAKDISIGNKMINARAESLFEKPSFSKLIQRKRCLIPATGYFEWKKQEESKKKIPYFIKMKSNELLTFAGLWDTWKSPDGSLVRTATVITSEPNELTKQIHNRMPVIISEEDRDFWLSSEADLNYIRNLLMPYSSDELIAYEVSSSVNSPVYDSSDNIIPIAD